MRPLSPAQRHRARILQEQVQAASPYGVELAGNAYDLMRIKLSQDKNRLSAIQSHERRAELKAKLLPEYFDWIETATTKGAGAQDNVLTTIMVWCFDAGAYQLGLCIAKYVIEHRMPMADDYKRSPAAIVIDELANAYLRGNWAPLIVGEADGARSLVPWQKDAREYATLALARAQAITAEQDAPDQARAKLHKAIAYATIGKVQTAEEPDLGGIGPDVLRDALTNLQRALELDSASGVKKDIERVERALAKAGKPDAPAPAPAPAAPPDSKAPAKACKPTAAAKKPPAAPRKTAARR
ncbi:small terminase subunit [Xenophilus aerolatus]|nr:small terminase subunit [Xenophilus aerolatus]